LDIVSNQNLSMEMFLIRLLYLKKDRINIDQEKVNFSDEKNFNDSVKTRKLNLNIDEDILEVKNKTISQIKNFSQEENSKPDKKIEVKLKNIEIKNFDELIKLCNQKKELKLKYELETNVSLVSFADQKIEISFNENLDRDFVKELTFKLFEWTGQRWIIAFSKEVGMISKKQQIEDEKSKIIEKVKSEDVYKKVLELIPDAELVDIKLKDNE